MELLSLPNPKFEDLKSDLEKIIDNFRKYYSTKIAFDACVSFDERRDLSCPELRELNDSLSVLEQALATYYVAKNGHKYAHEERPKITWTSIS